MAVALAWAFYLVAGVACLAFGWSWLAPRLPRRVRITILALVASGSVIALAVAGLTPHDYKPGDLYESYNALIVLTVELLLAVAGLAAALVAAGRHGANSPALLGVGIYLAGVGLTLYLMLEGETSLQAPLLIFLGASTALAAALRMLGLIAWQARVLGPAAGAALALLAEALRGAGIRGRGPQEASSTLLAVAAVSAILLLLLCALFLRSHRQALVGSLARATAGLAATDFVLLLRGPGEWVAAPASRSTTLYGMPLALLAAAISLLLLERTYGRPPATGHHSRPQTFGRRGWAAGRWPVAAGLLALLLVAAIWQPSAEACVVTPYAAQTSPVARVPGNDQGAASGAPRGAPGVPDFDKLCTHRDPGIGQILYVLYPGCKWAQVDPTYPIVQASGTLELADISNADAPWLHTSHDLSLALTADPQSTWLALGGPPGALLHAEVETGGFPVEYRPVVGDRVTVIGRWIYDCGHEPKTEIHPAAVVAAEHDEWRTGISGVPARAANSGAVGLPQRVRVVRIWMNGSPGVVPVPLAPFDLRVSFPAAPSGSATPAVQVAAGFPNAVRWSIDPAASQAILHVTPPSASGAAYLEMVLGYREAATGPAPPTYVVSYEKLVVHDDLRGAARNNAGPYLYFPLLGFAGSGRWIMQGIAGHEWRDILPSVDVVSGGTYPLNSVAPVAITAPGDQHLQMMVTGYAENDPSDGVSLASGSVSGPSPLMWDAGRLSDLCCSKELSYTPTFGAWTLYWSVAMAGSKRET